MEQKPFFLRKSIERSQCFFTGIAGSVDHFKITAGAGDIKPFTGFVAFKLQFRFENGLIKTGFIEWGAGLIQVYIRTVAVPVIKCTEE